MKPAHAINFQEINYTLGCFKTFINAACRSSEKLGRFASVAVYNILKLLRISYVSNGVIREIIMERAF